jgi:uncharacterized coiled-coil DUF342 family protein
VDDDLLNERRAALETERERLNRAIVNRTPELNDVRVHRQETEDRLSLIDSQRDVARRNVEQLAQRVENLRGAPDDPQTLAGVDTLLQRANDVPQRIAAVRDVILGATRRLHRLLMRRLASMQQLYKPAADFVETNELACETELEFVADLAVGPNWSETNRGLA